MKLLTKTVMRTVATALVAVMLAACGSSGGTGGSSSPANTSGTNESAASASTIQDSDKVLKVRKISALVSTDWDKITSTSDYQLLSTNVFEGLYGINEAHGGYYNELAKDVAISDDGKTYTITLVDATFQNGDPLKASDVVFSYNRAISNPRWNYLTSMINSVDAPDDKTFVLTLDYPYSPIAHTFFSIKIMSEREVTEVGESFGTQVHKAGTGPYYISEYDPAASIKLKAYENYWRGTPAVSDVEFVLITEDSAAVIAYENGEIDYITDAPTAEWETLTRAAGERSEIAKGNNVRMLCINYDSPNNNRILANSLVREAICYAVNKETVNKVATNGYGTVAYEYMPSEYVETSPPASEGGFKLYDYDPEKSKALLKEAGYTDADLEAGIQIGTITTYGAANGEKAKQAQVIQSNLADVGLICEVEVADVSIISPRIHSYDYDLAVFGDSGNFDYNNIRQQVHSESVGMDVVRFKTDNSPFNWQRIEELCDLGVASSDTTERLKYYTELWSIVQDTATFMPLIHMPVAIVWSDRIDPGDLCPTYFHLYDFKWI